MVTLPAMLGVNKPLLPMLPEEADQVTGVV